MKSLVIMPNWVGDSIMALPVLATLGATERRLTVLIRPHLESLIATQPGVSETLLHAADRGDPIALLRSADFDEAVILPNSFRSAWWIFRAGIPRRWGYHSASIEGILRRLMLRPSVPRSSDRARHQVEDYAALLTAMDAPTPERWRPELVLTREQRDSGAALLTRSRLDIDRSPLIGLFPGAEFGPGKRWPWRRFAELAVQNRRRQPGCQQIILAGPKEVWLAVRVHEESGKVHPVIGPDLDLGRLASVIARLDLLITNDSGPMHIAAALGVPCLGLFGPTNPVRTRPVGERHEVIYTDRWCSPCFRRRCPLLHHRCMRDISVDQVAETASRILAAQSS